jgi:hypothetical protein
MNMTKLLDMTVGVLSANLTCVMGENACTEDLLVYTQAVMAAVQNLDPEVVYMDKTEK